MEFGLRPMGGLEVEHNNIGEMLAMLVLSSEDEKFAALPEACGVPWNSVSVEIQVLCGNRAVSTYPFVRPEYPRSCRPDSIVV